MAKGITKEFSLPGVNKNLLEGLREKTETDVEIKSLGRGEFRFSGPALDIQTLLTEAIWYCPAQNRPA